ncbi:MAG: DUF433 domain-containing protein [Nitrospiria bacterium]
MAVETGYPYILLDEKREAIIQGTSLKVIELVVEKLAYGWSSEEIHLQHPCLTLGQIHTALAYYWDHRDTLDEEITTRLEQAETLRRQLKPASSPLILRLKAKGLL